MGQGDKNGNSGSGGNSGDPRRKKPSRTCTICGSPMFERNGIWRCPICDMF